VSGNVPHRVAPFMALPCVVLLAAALDEAEKAATDKITAYREQAGQ
jgi:hypothetical protein